MTTSSSSTSPQPAPRSVPRSIPPSIAEPPATIDSRDDVHDALDFVRYGFDVVTTLAEETTLEITDVSYAALESVGAWPVVLWPIHKVQRGATRLVFRAVRVGGHVVTGVAEVGVWIMR